MLHLPPRLYELAGGAGAWQPVAHITLAEEHSATPQDGPIRRSDVAEEAGRVALEFRGVVRPGRLVIRRGTRAVSDEHVDLPQRRSLRQRGNAACAEVRVAIRERRRSYAGRGDDGQLQHLGTRFESSDQRARRADAAYRETQTRCAVAGVIWDLKCCLSLCNKGQYLAELDDYGKCTSAARQTSGAGAAPAAVPAAAPAAAPRAAATAAAPAGIISRNDAHQPEEPAEPAVAA